MHMCFFTVACRICLALFQKKKQWGAIHMAICGWSSMISLKFHGWSFYRKISIMWVVVLAQIEFHG